MEAKIFFILIYFLYPIGVVLIYILIHAIHPINFLALVMKKKYTVFLPFLL